MKSLGTDLYVQRGEIKSFDFDVRTAKGDPLMVFNGWQNPFLVITISSNLYKQTDDKNIVYWLDLDRRIVEKEDGSYTHENTPFKRFSSMEPLYLETFSVDEAKAKYPKIILNTESDSLLEIKNFLFFTDPNGDDNRIYKYVTAYELLNDLSIPESEEWADYGFRIIKQFHTDDLVEQGYFYDLKIVAGQTVQEYIAGILHGQGIEGMNAVTGMPWDETAAQSYIDLISDSTIRAEVQSLFDSGVPLMPHHDTVMSLLTPSNLFVSADIQRR